MSASSTLASTLPAVAPARAEPLGISPEGAPLEALDVPAGAFLDAVPWEGPSPDPDTLDAATFLAWL